MTVDGVVIDTVVTDLVESRALPQLLNCGTATVTSSGTHTIGVNVKVDETEISYDKDYQSFKAGTSFIPLVVVLVLAATTQMVSLVHFTASFVAYASTSTHTYILHMFSGRALAGIRNFHRLLHDHRHYHGRLPHHARYVSS